MRICAVPICAVPRGDPIAGISSTCDAPLMFPILDFGVWQGCGDPTLTDCIYACRGATTDTSPDNGYATMLASRVYFLAADGSSRDAAEFAEHDY